MKYTLTPIHNIIKYTIAYLPTLKSQKSDSAMRSEQASERLMAGGPGARSRAPGGVQGQRPGGGQGGEAPWSSWACTL